MSDSIIENVIADSVVEQQPNQAHDAPADDGASSEPQEEVVESSNKEAVDQAPQADREEFPKKAQNAISRRDKKINKQQAELDDLRRQVEALQKAQAPAEPKKEDGPPSEDDFESYADYLRADVAYRAKEQIGKEFSNRDEQAKQAQAEQAQAQWLESKQQEVAGKLREAKETIPDLPDVFNENIDILDSFSLPENQHIEYAFYDAEDPVSAFYALAKEGKLESLTQMSPGRAAMEIARAEARGQSLVNPKKPSRAPEPIKGAKGTGQFNKTLDSMSANELLEFVRK